MKKEVSDLFFEFTKLEEIIRNSMMPNDREIIKGINIVREIVREINLEEVNSELKDKVILMICLYRKEIQDKGRIINSYIEYGINQGIRLINGMINYNENLYEDKMIRIRRD